MGRGSASTVERQHPGLGAVADIVQEEGYVQVVVGLREQHLVVPLVCVETRLRAGLAHTVVPGITGRCGGGEGGRRGAVRPGRGRWAGGPRWGVERTVPALVEVPWPRWPPALTARGGTVHLQEMVYSPLRSVFSQTMATLSHCPCSLKTSRGAGRGVPLRGSVRPPTAAQDALHPPRPAAPACPSPGPAPAPPPAVPRMLRRGCSDADSSGAGQGGARASASPARLARWHAREVELELQVAVVQALDGADEDPQVPVLLDPPHVVRGHGARVPDPGHLRTTLC